MTNVMIHGRVTKDIELKATNSGKSVCSFSVAVDRKNGADKATDFFSVTAWNGTAENISKYFNKGDGIIVVGELQNRTFEQDGSKRTVTEIIANRFDFPMGKKAETKPEPTDKQDKNNFFPVMGENDDDLPF